MTSSGLLYVIAAPSGAGKTSLVQELANRRADLKLSISHTTRDRRPGEANRVDYHFVSKETFEAMIARNEFLEYAHVFEHLYGTSRQWVEDTLAAGYHVILEIDWQGFQQIKKHFPDVISIFILPPSLTELRRRLVNRKQDSPEVIEKRLADAAVTLAHIEEFQFIVINEYFEEALHQIQEIINISQFGGAVQRKKYASLIQDLKKLTLNEPAK